MKSTSTIMQYRSESSDYRYSDFVRKLPELESTLSGESPVRIGILRSYTVEPIEPLLRFMAVLDGYRAQVHVGGYNQQVQEILDPRSGLYEFQPNIVIMMIRLEEMLPDFIDAFETHTTSEWGRLLKDLASEIGGLVGNLQSNSRCQVLVQNASLPVAPSRGIQDAQGSVGQARLVADFNAHLAQALESTAGAYIWDYAGFAARVGSATLSDPKMWYVSRNPFRLSAYPSLARDLQKYLRAMLGIVKKCVVLDLDNTLWGGVVGEDGIAGISLGHTYPGNCFREFQRELLKLYHRGILLAINSKNNEDDALAAIASHPDMILREEHFAAWQINWQNKSKNLQALAAELNIGLDSMLMIDDSDVECAMIEDQLPGFDIYRLPANPYDIPRFLDEVPGLERISLTDEDRQKGQMYKAQVERRKAETDFGDLEAFLSSLNLEVDIQAAGEFSIPRVAQLTQKTNQFNMTTRRYTEAEIAVMVATPNQHVFAVSAKDKFGDYGIVGVAIVRIEDANCDIETFLLSCRVIGRRIEAAIVSFIAEFARTNGATRLSGEFRPTSKNAPAADVYPDLGFEKVDDCRFVANLRQVAFASPAFIELRAPDVR